MKSFIASTAIFAAFVVAQSPETLQALDSLPDCGKTCINNMLGQAQSLGCQPTDVACLCANQNFGYGIRDCTQEACPPTANRAQVIDFGTMFCASKSDPPPSPPLESDRPLGIASNSGGTTTATTSGGTNTVIVATGPSTTSTTVVGPGAATGGAVITTTDGSGSTVTTTLAPIATGLSPSNGSLTGSNSTSGTGAGSTNSSSPIGGGPSNGTSAGNSTMGGNSTASGTEASGTATESSSEATATGEDSATTTGGSEEASSTAEGGASQTSATTGAAANTHHVAAAGVIGFAGLAAMVLL
ncbi:MAG: hypothetical protein Q9211_007108 [Gyalolechia sp. 1 TL-2023]